MWEHYHSSFCHLGKISLAYHLNFFSPLDPDSSADRGGALAALLSGRGSLLSPAARGLLPGRSGQTQEDLRLEPQTGQPGPAHSAHHPGSTVETTTGLLPSAGREGGVSAAAEKVRSSEKRPALSE